jgi:hypothetical protein
VADTVEQDVAEAAEYLPIVISQARGMEVVEGQ